jgi:hypothetical protein
MANKDLKSTDSSKTDQDAGGLPIPFDRDTLHQDTVIVFLHQVRTLGWMCEGPAAWRVTGKPLADESLLFDPDASAEELGLAYADIQHTPFAQCLERMYDYGYLGLLDESADAMDYESIYTWISAVLTDIRHSSVMNEWSTYGGEESASAERSLRVAELANARRVLEGGENFFYFRSGMPDDESVTAGSLTVRQMAFLAGMEEMSIRAAANPRRANPLTTKTEEGRTRISIDVAKAWLKSKSRYVPITRRWSSGEIDLVGRRFTGIDALCAALETRCAFLTLRDGRRDELDRQLVELGIIVHRSPDSMQNSLSLEKAHCLNGDLMRQLAAILELPADLLVLRAREAVASEELSAVERELRVLANIKTSA